MDLTGILAIGTQVLSVAAMIIAGLFVSGIIGGVLYFGLKYKRYSQFNCVILHRDGFGQLTEKFDKAGIYIDKKTKNKRLYLQKSNVGLNPDNVPYIPGKSGKKTVYLLQTGLKNFHFIKVNVNEPAVTLTVGEEDVNWAVNAYERQKRIFAHNALLQYLPFIGLAFVSIIILIIFMYFFKEFGVLGSVAASLRDAAQALSACNAGTTVIGG